MGIAEAPNLAWHIALAAGAAAVAIMTMLWSFKSSDRISSQGLSAPTESFEVWEERRGPRSFFGRLVLVCFVVFNIWMVIELVNFFSKLEGVRGEFRDNGFAQLGIHLMANARLNEIFVFWAIGTAVLGAGVLGTRGRKLMVRRVG